MSDVKHPYSVQEALQQAEEANLYDVLIIGTRSDGKLFMDAYGLTRADAFYQMDLAKMFQLGLMVNGEDDDGGEQG